MPQPEFNDAGQLVAGTTAPATGRAIDQFRTVARLTLRLQQATVRLGELAAQVPVGEMSAYLEATEKVRATFEEQAPEPPHAPPRPAPPTESAQPDDPQCRMSSWRGNTKKAYGPGGFNRCVLPAGPEHTEHEDGWGNVFTLTGGVFRQLRNEHKGTDVL